MARLSRLSREAADRPLFSVENFSLKSAAFRSAFICACVADLMRLLTLTFQLILTSSARKLSVGVTTDFWAAVKEESNGGFYDYETRGGVLDEHCTSLDGPDCNPAKKKTALEVQQLLKQEVHVDGMEQVGTHDTLRDARIRSSIWSVCVPPGGESALHFAVFAGQVDTIQVLSGIRFRLSGIRFCLGTHLNL